MIANGARIPCAECETILADVEVLVHVRECRHESGDGYGYARWLDTDAAVFCSVSCMVVFYGRLQGDAP